MSVSRTALALMAHPDDAELFCGGTLARLHASGWRVHIATLTAGDCGTTREDRWQISARRTAEARRAAELIDARYHCLDEDDGFVVHDKPTVRKVIDLFRAVAPGLVITHAPSDYMLDHEVTSRLARTGSFMYPARNAARLALKEGSRIPHLYYCDPLEGRDALGRAVEPTTFVDITEQLDVKIQMLQCHESQAEWLRQHHGTDEYVEAMTRHATERGIHAGVAFAEAFVQHRGAAYPGDDVLAEAFGYTVA